MYICDPCPMCYLMLLVFDQYKSISCSAGDERWIYDLCAQFGRDCTIKSEFYKNPFENQPFKKSQIVTFAKKNYQAFHFNGTEAIKHKLNELQLAEVIAQCNAKTAILLLYLQNKA